MIFAHVKTACTVILFHLVVSAMLFGCGGGQTVKVSGTASEIERDSQSRKVNELILKAATMPKVKSEADYIIGAEDLLDIEVFQVEELRKTVRVSSEGYIGIPLTGQVKAKGLTPRQLEKEIARRLDKYMEEPLVSVYVKEYRAQKIGVIGAVSSPKVYAVTGQMYLLDMLSMSGGLTGEAGNICYILRPANIERPAEQKTETIVIDLIELLEKGNAALNIPVYTGDVIHVPKGGTVFVDGAVEKPGAFPLRGKMTLMQAIAVAGGLKYEADSSDIKIYRDNGKGTREAIPAAYDVMRNTEENDLVLREYDIVIVPKSGVKNFLSGFVNFMRGFVSFGHTL